jgi:hypothetical protein
MNITLDDSAIEFTLSDDLEFNLSRNNIEFTLNAEAEEENARLLEDGFYRLLEDGGIRLLE